MGRIDNDKAARAAVVRVLWRWPSFMLSMALSLGALSLQVAAQDRLERRSKSYDFTLGGVHYRIPGSYMQPTTIPGDVDKYLRFGFWISDGKPVDVNVPALGTKGRVGRAVFWPPETGRPFFSIDDFLVFVLEVSPLDERQGTERRRLTREGLTKARSNAAFAMEDGLECVAYPSGAKNCITPVDWDPDVSLSLSYHIADNPSWNMHFYSRADALWVKVSFPGLGQSRWSEVVCRTLLLVRSWRVSDGPSPPDCTKQRRLSQAEG